MNYCINLKKRKGKPFCKLINEEISFSRCRECVNKEYKNKSVTNCHQLKRKTHECKKQHTKALNKQKMRLKSNKLAKLEQNRFSVFTDNKEKCYLCGSDYNLTWHEIFRGANRRNSMRFGFCLRLCLNCHEEKQEDVDFNEFWHRKAQNYYEDNIGSREDFLAIFRRNYLD